MYSPLRGPQAGHKALHACTSPQGGGRSPSDGLPPWGGGGDCKGSPTQTVAPSTDASKQNTSKAGCVGCAGVWGCQDIGVMSGDSGDLGDATTTASSLES